MKLVPEYEWWCDAHKEWHPYNVIECGLRSYSCKAKQRLAGREVPD